MTYTKQILRMLLISVNFHRLLPFPVKEVVKDILHMHLLEDEPVFMR